MRKTFMDESSKLKPRMTFNPEDEVLQGTLHRVLTLVLNMYPILARNVALASEQNVSEAQWRVTLDVIITQLFKSEGSLLANDVFAM